MRLWKKNKKNNIVKMVQKYNGKSKEEEKENIFECVFGCYFFHYLPTFIWRRIYMYIRM